MTFPLANEERNVLFLGKHMVENNSGNSRIYLDEASLSMEMETVVRLTAMKGPICITSVKTEFHDINEALFIPRTREKSFSLRGGHKLLFCQVF